MPADFLKKLPVSEDERARLATLGAYKPLTLLNMRRASQKAFDDRFPPGRGEFIANELEKLLTVEERQSLSKPPKAPGRLGARLDSPPKPGCEK